MIALKLAGFVYLDTVQNQLQFGPAQWLLPGGAGFYPELALFQPFAPQTETGGFEVEHFHLGAAAVHKDKIVATERVMIELAFDQCEQPIKGFTHIGWLGAEQDMRLASRGKQQC